jgi:A/G-specific adenine glycosylase
MLQQTQAGRVARLFPDFLDRFPDVGALAGATRAEVIRAWSGLGYNRRAVALSAAARAIVHEHGGRIPSDPAVLRTLPGIGPYTAAAIAAFAFGAALVALDTNVARVVARARLGVEPDEASDATIMRAATAWSGGADAATWNQAVMDLGREVCRSTPRCAACPVARACRSRGTVRARSRGRGGPAFAGSSRQVRGAVVATLRTRHAASVAWLGLASGGEPAKVLAAIHGLHREGIVVAGPAALEGSPRGRVRLAT